jgi:hypothetical protein
MAGAVPDFDLIIGGKRGLGGGGGAGSPHRAPEEAARPDQTFATGGWGVWGPRHASTTHDPTTARAGHSHTFLFSPNNTGGPIFDKSKPATRESLLNVSTRLGHVWWCLGHVGLEAHRVSGLPSSVEAPLPALRPRRHTTPPASRRPPRSRQLPEEARV